MTSDSDKLLPCPCGQTPKSLCIADGSTYRWRMIDGNCCGWECESSRIPIDATPEEVERLCRQSWNEMPRTPVSDGWIAHRDKLLSLLQAVGHVGVDFGEGEYQLGREDIELAQHLYADLSPPENNHE